MACKEPRRASKLYVRFLTGVYSNCGLSELGKNRNKLDACAERKLFKKQLDIWVLPLAGEAHGDVQALAPFILFILLSSLIMIH